MPSVSVRGYLADFSGRYWAVTICGYLLNLLAVPLLALIRTTATSIRRR